MKGTPLVVSMLQKHTIYLWEIHCFWAWWFCIMALCTFTDNSKGLFLQIILAFADYAGNGSLLCYIILVGCIYYSGPSTTNVELPYIWHLFCLMDALWRLCGGYLEALWRPDGGCCIAKERDGLGDQHFHFWCMQIRANIVIIGKHPSWMRNRRWFIAQNRHTYYSIQGMPA